MTYGGRRAWEGELAAAAHGTNSVQALHLVHDGAAAFNTMTVAGAFEQRLFIHNTPTPLFTDIIFKGFKEHHTVLCVVVAEARVVLRADLFLWSQVLGLRLWLWTGCRCRFN